ncbi:MAG: glycosyltransferase family 4 protein [Thermoplasmata archaeon]|nr:glycosyltransferase family 4 protein [Thermoplasmata archaeon]
MVAPSVKIPENLAQSVHQYEFAKRLVENGFEVHLVCRRPQAPPEIDDGIVFHKIMSKEFPLKRPVFTLDTVRFLKNLLKRHKFDLIHDRGYLFGGAGTKVGNKNDIPVILQIDDDWIETEALASRITSTNFYKSRALNWCKKLMTKVDYAFTVSETLRQRVISTWGGDGEKISVVPNGADIDKFKPDREPLGLRQDLGLDEDSKVVTFVGALGPWHGVNYLVEAAPLILKKVPDAHLWLVGGAQEYDSMYLRDLITNLKIKDHVHIIGSRPSEQIPRILVESDVGVAPYPQFDMGFSPLKIFEYMAAGVPIVCSDLPSLREILTDNQTGILVESENIEALAAAITEVLKNPKLSQRLVVNARRAVEERYSWEAVTEKLITLYDKLI